MPSSPPSQSTLPFDAAAAGGGGAHALAGRALPGEAGVWDELRDDRGALRPAWQRLAATLPPLAPEGIAGDLDRRLAQVAQRIRADGVTHNVFAAADAAAAPAAARDGVEGDRADDDGTRAARPWSLELLPLLIEPADWAAIEAGVVQRAVLLQQLMHDVHGPQRLLHDGLLPPALLFRHPGFMRQLIGTTADPALRLFIVAFDIARGPDGRWWLVAQRTQGPSGLGYVLHNRLVVSRQFPDAFRDLRVQHIATSYRRLLDTLEAAAQQVALDHGDGHVPRIVLLTPGPFSETYFEHAYLARYLGLPLVEGGDLTVREQRLFLKTVEGLEPVHGVLRRLDDDWCDPLELRADSALGVPGLLQAARAGRVVMANALGSGFLESPALQGFMPAIGERLLGQGLMLPSLPTWWCGEAAAFAAVRQSLGERTVRGSFPQGTRASAAGARDAATIAADPDAWTVQGRLRFSRAPIWGGGAITPRPALVRVYAIADAQGRWHVLPGGMTRVARREDSSVSMQHGGSSLDTWVLTDGPVDTFSMLPQRLQVDDLAQRRRPVSSRTAENLFWLGRYTERAEQQLRLARALLQLPDSDDDVAPAPLLQALAALAATTGLAAPGVVPHTRGMAARLAQAVLAALGDAGGTGGTASLAFHLAALERASSVLRERLSPEHWGLIRSMREGFAAALDKGHDAAPSRAAALLALDRLGLQLAAATGAQTDRMTRDHGWRLLTVGRLIERLIGMARRLEAFVGAGALGSVAGVEALLEQFDSLITFRARYQRHEDLLALADLLVLDETNPRAFAGVLRRLRTEIGKLPGRDDTRAALLALLPPQGAGLTLDALRDADDAAIAGVLSRLAGGLADRAAQLADRVGECFFTLAQGADQRV
jgi:uncharacterized circularly permuted ATP-grasp superfamily protein/uncharacterized alpha-E superfamily protein